MNNENKIKELQHKIKHLNFEIKEIEYEISQHKKELEAMNIYEHYGLKEIYQICKNFKKEDDYFWIKENHFLNNFLYICVSKKGYRYHIQIGTNTGYNLHLNFNDDNISALVFMPEKVEKVIHQGLLSLLTKKTGNPYRVVIDYNGDKSLINIEA